MSTQLDPQDVLNAFLTQAENAGENIDQLTDLHRFVTALPMILEDLLHLPMRPQTYMKALAKVKQYQLDNGWVEASLEAIGRALAESEDKVEEVHVSELPDSEIWSEESLVTTEGDLRQQLQKEIDFYNGPIPKGVYIPDVAETVANRLVHFPADFLYSPDWARQYLTRLDSDQ